MPTAAAPTVSDDEITNALAAAHRAARSKARGRSEEFLDALVDAATDAVLWASRKYTLERGENWDAFCAAAVRSFLTNAARRWARDSANRPNVLSLSGATDADEDVNPELAGLVAKPVHGPGELDLPISIRELPDEMQAAVRFFYLDRFTLRECALLLGCEREKVRELLKRAAAILAPGREVPNRRPNTRRILR